MNPAQDKPSLFFSFVLSVRTRLLESIIAPAPSVISRGEGGEPAQQGGLCQRELFDVFWHHEQVKQWKCQRLVSQIKAITATTDIFTCSGIQQKLDFHSTGLFRVISVHP